jgi:hypothetical protein
MKTNEKQPTSDINAFNYCVSFIDLLGQRVSLQDQGLLPIFATEDDKINFNATLKESIGAIRRLQRQAETMLGPILDRNPESTFRASLPKEQHQIWDEMTQARVTTQRWSDGLVSFVCLGDADIKCKMNGVYALFCSAGALCLLGLANRSPVRGAIDVAWGVELNPGELYGAAVARAYELESEVAQYPRIVIGSETVKLLTIHSKNPAQDPFSQIDKKLAELCLGMIIPDTDGHMILHYLGESFQFAATHNAHAQFYESARNFAIEQFERHQANQDTKLAFRYSHLLNYLDAFPPTNP